MVTLNHLHTLTFHKTSLKHNRNHLFSYKKHIHFDISIISVECDAAAEYGDYLGGYTHLTRMFKPSKVTICKKMWSQTLAF